MTTGGKRSGPRKCQGLGGCPQLQPSSTFLHWPGPGAKTRPSMGARVFSVTVTYKLLTPGLRLGPTGSAEAAAMAPRPGPVAALTGPGCPGRGS